MNVGNDSFKQKNSIWNINISHASKTALSYFSAYGIIIYKETNIFGNVHIALKRNDGTARVKQD